MRKNRRLKIFKIWLLEVNALLVAKVLWPSVLEMELILEVIKWVSVMAVFTVAGLSGTNMVFDWANGKKKKQEVEE